ncbi:MAG: class I SAM-dependent methyltransferase [Thermoanaerobaculia bacterium]
MWYEQRCNGCRRKALNLKGGPAEKFGALAAFFYRRWGEPTLEPLYRRIAAEIPIEEGRLLDIGCGPGRLDRLIAAARPRLSVVGLDSSPAMLRQAERGQPLPNLEFHLGSIDGSAFREGFDFAIALLSFHHWEEPRGGLEAVYQGLKPGGRFWIYESDPDAPDAELRRDHAPLWGWLSVPCWLLRAASRGHGFRLAEVDTVVRHVVAQTSFWTLEAARTGSTLRLALEKTSRQLSPGRA